MKSGQYLSPRLALDERRLKGTSFFSSLSISEHGSSTKTGIQNHAMGFMGHYSANVWCIICRIALLKRSKVSMLFLHNFDTGTSYFRTMRMGPPEQTMSVYDLNETDQAVKYLRPVRIFPIISNRKDHPLLEKQPPTTYSKSRSTCLSIIYAWPVTYCPKTGQQNIVRLIVSCSLCKMRNRIRKYR